MVKSFIEWLVFTDIGNKIIDLKSSHSVHSLLLIKMHRFLVPVKKPNMPDPSMEKTQEKRDLVQNVNNYLGKTLGSHPISGKFYFILHAKIKNQVELYFTPLLVYELDVIITSIISTFHR